MGSQFHDWIDYKGGYIFKRVPDRVTRMGSQIVGILRVRKFLASGIKDGRAKGKKERKGTLFKCIIDLALEH